MTTAVFGGTFNPVHTSHILMAEYVNSLEIIDELMIMPTNIPPHKSAGELVCADHRLKMCSMAFSHLSKARISEIEINRTGKSYTFDTLSLLSRNGKKLYLVCGGDMIETFHKWYRFEEILPLADIIAFRRKGGKTTGFDKGLELIRSYGGNVIEADVSIPELSSTKIREAIKNGCNTKGLIPSCVAEYILQNGLYR